MKSAQTFMKNNIQGNSCNEELAGLQVGLQDKVLI